MRFFFQTLFEKDLPWVFGCLIAVVTRTAFICSKIRTRWQFWGFVATLRHSLYIRTASSWHIFSNFLNCTGWNWFMSHLGSATWAEYSTLNLCPDRLHDYHNLRLINGSSLAISSHLFVIGIFFFTQNWGSEGHFEGQSSLNLNWFKSYDTKCWKLQNHTNPIVQSVTM